MKHKSILLQIHSCWGCPQQHTWKLITNSVWNKAQTSEMTVQSI